MRPIAGLQSDRVPLQGSAQITNSADKKSAISIDKTHTCAYAHACTVVQIRFFSPPLILLFYDESYFHYNATGMQTVQLELIAAACGLNCDACD